MRPCMTADEARLWDAANRYMVHRAASPCDDCPLAFAREMRALGCCDGVPGPKVGRPSMGAVRRRIGGPHANRYPTEEERLAARRRSWREYKARKRVAA